jgi:hypothetical protein
VKTYRITGSIKNCQRRFVEQFGGRNPPSNGCKRLVAGCVAVGRTVFTNKNLICKKDFSINIVKHISDYRQGLN